jgi:hypothetical protein
MNKMGIFLLFLFASCTKVTKPDNSNNVVCANNFIRSIFQGEFDKANTIMIQNEANKDCLKKRKFNYNQLVTKNLKEQYKAASIVLKTITETDSISFFEYKDPIRKVALPPLKVIKINNEWLVDYAYNCSGNL